MKTKKSLISVFVAALLLVAAVCGVLVFGTSAAGVNHVYIVRGTSQGSLSSFDTATAYETPTEEGDALVFDTITGALSYAAFADTFGAEDTLEIQMDPTDDARAPTGKYTLTAKGGSGNYFLSAAASGHINRKGGSLLPITILPHANQATAAAASENGKFTIAWPFATGFQECSNNYTIKDTFLDFDGDGATIIAAPMIGVAGRLELYNCDVTIPTVSGTSNTVSYIAATPRIASFLPFKNATEYAAMTDANGYYTSEVVFSGTTTTPAGLEIYGNIHTSASDFAKFADLADGTCNVSKLASKIVVKDTATINEDLVALSKANVYYPNTEIEILGGTVNGKVAGVTTVAQTTTRTVARTVTITLDGGTITGTLAGVNGQACAADITVNVNYKSGTVAGIYGCTGQVNAALFGTVNVNIDGNYDNSVGIYGGTGCNIAGTLNLNLNSGTITNAVYGLISLSSGVKPTVKDGGTFTLTNNGAIVKGNLGCFGGNGNATGAAYGKVESGGKVIVDLKGGEIANLTYGFIYGAYGTGYGFQEGSSARIILDGVAPLNSSSTSTSPVIYFNRANPFAGDFYVDIFDYNETRNNTFYRLWQGITRNAGSTYLTVDTTVDGWGGSEENKPGASVTLPGFLQTFTGTIAAETNSYTRINGGTGSTVSIAGLHTVPATYMHNDVHNCQITQQYCAIRSGTVTGGIKTIENNFYNVDMSIAENALNTSDKSAYVRLGYGQGNGTISYPSFTENTHVVNTFDACTSNPTKEMWICGGGAGPVTLGSITNYFIQTGDKANNIDNFANLYGARKAIAGTTDPVEYEDFTATVGTIVNSFQGENTFKTFAGGQIATAGNATIGSLANYVSGKITIDTAFYDNSVQSDCVVTDSLINSFGYYWDGTQAVEAPVGEGLNGGYHSTYSPKTKGFSFGRFPAANATVQHTFHNTSFGYNIFIYEGEATFTGDSSMRDGAIKLADGTKLRLNVGDYGVYQNADGIVPGCFVRGIDILENNTVGGDVVIDGAYQVGRYGVTTSANSRIVCNTLTVNGGEFNRVIQANSITINGGTFGDAAAPVEMTAASITINGAATADKAPVFKLGTTVTGDSVVLTGGIVDLSMSSAGLITATEVSANTTITRTKTAFANEAVLLAVPETYADLITVDCSKVKGYAMKVLASGNCNVTGYLLDEASASLVITNRVEIKYILEKAPTERAMTNSGKTMAYSVATPYGNVNGILTAENYNAEKGWYEIILPAVGAADFADGFTFEGEVYGTKQFSVSAIAAAGAEMTTATPGEVALFKAISDYGAAAAGTLEALTSGVTVDTTDIPTSQLGGSHGTGKITFNGKTLLMGDAIGVRLTMALPTTATSATVKLYDEDVTDRCVIDLVNGNLDIYVNVLRMNDVLEINVYDDAGTLCLTLKDTVKNIANQLVAQDGTNMKAQATLAYIQAVQNYLAAQA